MHPTTAEEESIFLTRILERNARYVRDSNITVTVDRQHGTVDIEEHDYGGGLFLQWEDAYKFIRSAIHNWVESGMISQQTAYDAEAFHYTHLLDG